VLLGAVVLLVAVAVVSMGFGAQSIPPAEVWRALTSGDTAREAVLIVRDVRVPRMVLGIAVGAALAAAGALVQTTTRNPVAEPGILGVTAGAGFAITIGTVFGMAGSQYAQLLLAVAGAAVTSLVVQAVGRTSPLRLLLAGVAITFLLAGISLAMRLTLPDAFDRFRFWAVGSLAGREQLSQTVPLAVIAAGLACAMAMSRALSALALGEDVARTLGARVALTKITALALVTVLAGAATAVAGPIAFVGLIVPHLARRLAGGSVGWLIAFSMVLGAVLMLVSDIGSRILLPTGEVPVAIVTATLGGLALIAVVRRPGVLHS
jgi:iron complex transport system permease protein